MFARLIEIMGGKSHAFPHRFLISRYLKPIQPQVASPLPLKQKFETETQLQAPGGRTTLGLDRWCLGGYVWIGNHSMAAAQSTKNGCAR